jgi:hypothetical protein
VSNKVFSISTIFIEITIKGLRYIEGNRLVRTDNVISPNNTCDLNRKNKDVMLQHRFLCHKMSLCTIQVSAGQSLAWWVSRETDTLLCHRALAVLPPYSTLLSMVGIHKRVITSANKQTAKFTSSDTNMKHRWPNKHSVSHTFLVENYQLKSKNGAHTTGNIWYQSIVMN